jgi:hypothetical protein
MSHVPDLLPTRLVADILGVSVGRISQLSAARNVLPTLIGGRRLWTQEQVSQLRPKKNGRPRKGIKPGKDGDK